MVLILENTRIFIHLHCYQASKNSINCNEIKRLRNPNSIICRIHRPRIRLVRTFQTRVTSHFHQTPEVIELQNEPLSIETTWRTNSNCRTCHVVLNKTKARACSEDLTRSRGKVALDCVDERVRPSGIHDDSSWCATKRHAIYSDTLALPVVSPELDLTGPRRILLAPTRTSQMPLGHSYCPGTAPCCPEKLFSCSANFSSSKTVPGSRSDEHIMSTRFPIEITSSTDFSLSSSVPRLRLSRKSRDSLAIRTSIVSTFDMGHEQPLRHSTIIIDLLFQLDQAIEEWDSLGMDYPGHQSKVRVASRDPLM